MIIERYHKHTREIAFSIVQTEIESFRKKSSACIGMRVYEDGLIGVAGKPGICDENQERELVAAARRKLKLEIKYPFPPSAGLAKTVDMRREIIPESELALEVDELLYRLRQQIPDFSFGNQVSLGWTAEDLGNDRGLDLHFRDNHVMLGLTFKEKTSVNIMDGFVGYTSRQYDREAFLSMAEQVCEAYREKLDPLPAGRYPMIFSEDYSIVYNKFTGDLSGRRLATGGSLFSGRRGEQIFSDSFTLLQCRDPQQVLRPFFDMEGVVNDGFCHTLIEDGTIVCPYSDKRTAITCGLPLTGSAGGKYDTVPALECPPLKAVTSGQTLKELLDGQTGIYILMADGGGYTADGSFSTPVQLAFLCDGERLLGRLPEFQINGNLFSMFGDGYRGKSTNKLFPLEDSYPLVIEMSLE